MKAGSLADLVNMAARLRLATAAPRKQPPSAHRPSVHWDLGL